MDAYCIHVHGLSSSISKRKNFFIFFLLLTQQQTITSAAKISNIISEAFDSFLLIIESREMITAMKSRNINRPHDSSLQHFLSNVQLIVRLLLLAWTLIISGAMICRSASCVLLLDLDSLWCVVSSRNFQYLPSIMKHECMDTNFCFSRWEWIW